MPRKPTVDDVQKLMVETAYDLLRLGKRATPAERIEIFQTVTSWEKTTRGKPDNDANSQGNAFASYRQEINSGGGRAAAAQPKNAEAEEDELE